MATKETKHKISGTDKGKHANKETAFVGLEINVKPYRKWMKEHYERQSKTVSVVNAHYILASVNQVLFYSVINAASEHFKKNNLGFYDISVEALKNIIKLTPSLNNTFGLFVDKYDDKLDYQKQLCIDKRALNEYLNKYTFHDNFRVNLNKDAHNFLCYLAVQANIALANTALIMSEYAKKSRVNSNSLIASIKVHFNGKFYEDVMKKVDSVNTLLQNKTKQDSDKGKEKPELEQQQQNEDKDEPESEPETETEPETEPEPESESESEEEVVHSRKNKSQNYKKK